MDQLKFTEYNFFSNSIIRNNATKMLIRNVNMMIQFLKFLHSYSS